MKPLKIFSALLIVCGLSSCGYKKSVGDKVYVQLDRIHGMVVHSNPDCPKLDFYREDSIGDGLGGGVNVCAKCVKNEDIPKIEGHR